jgi:hypothetical protein
MKGLENNARTMMEDTQNDTSPEGTGGDAGSGKGGAKLIRGGNGADASPEPIGEAAETQAAEAAAVVAGTIRHAGRRAAAGAQAVRGQVEEGARVLAREALDGAQAAAAAAEDVTVHVGGDMLGEWMSYAQRAYIRNANAMGELLYCRTPFSLLRWQSNLFNETLSDFTDTNARVLRLASNKA